MSRELLFRRTAYRRQHLEAMGYRPRRVDGIDGALNPVTGFEIPVRNVHGHPAHCRASRRSVKQANPTVQCPICVGLGADVEPDPDAGLLAAQRGRGIGASACRGSARSVIARRTTASFGLPIFDRFARRSRFFTVHNAGPEVGGQFNIAGTKSVGSRRVTVTAPALCHVQRHQRRGFPGDFERNHQRRTGGTSFQDVLALHSS